MLRSVRLSYPEIYKKGSYNGVENKKFSVSFLIDKTEQAEQIVAINKEIKSICDKNGWKMSDINPTYMAFKDVSNKKTMEGKPYVGHDNMMGLTAKNKDKIVTLSYDKQIVTEEDNIFYGGCYVDAKVTFYTHTISGKCIACKVTGIRFVKDGESFAGAEPTTADDFDDLPPLDSKDIF